MAISRLHAKDTQLAAARRVARRVFAALGLGIRHKLPRTHEGRRTVARIPEGVLPLLPIVLGVESACGKDIHLVGRHQSLCGVLLLEVYLWCVLRPNL